MFDRENVTLGVIGLGYVGLPLAVEFAKHFRAVGYDANPARVAELRRGVDHTREVSDEELAGAPALRYVDDPSGLAGCNVFIVTVPTPIDRYKRPDLGPLIRATETVGRLLTRDSVVVYESTVFPGATEDVCVPVLEEQSGLAFNRDFAVGYSPERVNPGDRGHRLPDICKVTSGSTPEAADVVDWLYGHIIDAGTYRAESIRVAEAAKVIENTQRDLNIALINELALIFNRLEIDTEAVLKAAGTKWNFLPFRPGLVGGHCIGVDPYYLTHKAQAIGYQPEVILAGRRINDSMGAYVAEQVVKLATKRGVAITGSRILIMGLTFKENCPDVRNTRVVDIVAELRSYNAQVDVHDPWVDPEEARTEYGIDLVPDPQPGTYDGIVLAVGHDRFREMGAEAIRALGKPGAVLYDVKYVLAPSEVDGRL